MTEVKIGTTDRTELIKLRSSADGSDLTGIAHTDITASYVRVETDNDVTVSAITESALSAITDAHADGGWIAVDATNCPGLYRFDIPDGAYASGAVEVVITIIDAGDNDIESVQLKHDLVVNIVMDIADLIGAPDTTLAGDIAVVSSGGGGGGVQPV
jgi:hypothetical protein